ncbi:MAG: hypothetical protein AAF497_00575 [Planctomycetota bacterium]
MALNISHRREALQSGLGEAVDLRVTNFNLERSILSGLIHATLLKSGIA